MAGMDRSYWHGYLMARHNVSLVLGIVFLALALISALTGKCFVKGIGIVSRAEDHRTFRETIVVDCVIGLFCFGLYLYTFN